ncbi:hypothetical protein [Paeniglutamicibacter gangotriensis]|uniref:Integral membrane protein n=1 Tax=Paeniglutamicibacter gangotriensis Lz1y TaxID=1276920 RepID=M7MKH9_9MICC|nr:hypothetical protein [Paeniglutamicibacter gangotriensis]EMQ96812.1 hypothetical protein ADIAG_03949 [Paeniglutamicibacter gangotriensis Lz1y]
MGDLIAGILATVFSILVVVRAPGALREAARVRMWLAHLVMALVLWLSVTAVYMSVDALLGGRNITNLLSHFGFYLMFWLGGAEVALSIGRHDLYRLVHGTIGAMVLGAGAAAMTATFIAAAPEYSAMGLNPFRDDPLIVLYKVLSYLYPGFVAAVLARPMLRAAVESPGLLGSAKRFMAIGFILVPLVPVAHLGELLDPGYAMIVDLLLYPAIILVATGVTLAFIARRQINRDASTEHRQQAEHSD